MSDQNLTVPEDGKDLWSNRFRTSVGRYFARYVKWGIWYQDPEGGDVMGWIKDEDGCPALFSEKAAKDLAETCDGYTAKKLRVNLEPED